MAKADTAGSPEKATGTDDSTDRIEIGAALETKCIDTTGVTVQSAPGFDDEPDSVFLQLSGIGGLLSGKLILDLDQAEQLADDLERHAEQLRSE